MCHVLLRGCCISHATDKSNTKMLAVATLHSGLLKATAGKELSMLTLTLHNYSTFDAI